MSRFQAVFRLLYIGNDLLSEGLRYLRLLVGSKASLAAEVLFLRKQLAFYQERKIKPHRFNDSARLSMLLFAKLFDWKKALVNVKPETFLGWHHKLFQLFWRWKSRGGRPRLPKEIRRLIVEMATNNPTWGQERVANELSLKLGILVSPANGEEVLARRSGFRSKEGLYAALDDFRAQPRPCSDRLRFCHGGDGTFPPPVCFCARGSRQAKNPALQRNLSPDSPVDGAAVP